MSMLFYYIINHLYHPLFEFHSATVQQPKKLQKQVQCDLRKIQMKQMMVELAPDRHLVQ